MTREEFNTFSMQIVPHTAPGFENMTHQWWCQQHSEEFGDMIEKVSAINPKVIVEIGSAHGGNICYFDQMVAPDGLVIAIDIDPGAFSILDKKYGGYQRKGNIEIMPDYASTDKRTMIRFRNLLFGKKIDFLFIDGDHTYEGTKKDWEIYSPFVRSGGIIGFHDIAIEPGCKQAFDEIEEKKEILPVRYMGIGLVYKS